MNISAHKSSKYSKRVEESNVEKTKPYLFKAGSPSAEKPC
jgi:hypothetical protein